jgi:hypothetical protein
MSTAPPPTPPTPLAVRTWRREAQRAVRLAVTAIRSAHTQYEEVSEAGASHLAQLCNTLLTLSYLPAMPLGVLSAMSQDVRPAAKAKLQRQAAGLATKVLGCTEQLGTIAKVGFTGVAFTGCGILTNSMTYVQLFCLFVYLLLTECGMHLRSSSLSWLCLLCWSDGVRRMLTVPDWLMCALPTCCRRHRHRQVL